jgi:hypothetical protein
MYSVAHTMSIAIAWPASGSVLTRVRSRRMLMRSSRIERQGAHGRDAGTCTAVQ